MKKNSIALFVSLLIGSAPLIAETNLEVLRSSVSIGGLEIAMFTLDEAIALSYGSQMNVLSTLESAGEIGREPSIDFLIYFVGNNFYQDDVLLPVFRENFGGVMLDGIDELEAPVLDCSISRMQLSNGFQGFVVFINSRKTSAITSSNCIINGVRSSWSDVIVSDTAISFGDNFLLLIEELRI